MEDLLFTRAGRTPSLSRMRRVGLALPSLALLCAPGLLSGHWLGTAVYVGGLFVLVALLSLIFRGAWTKVDGAGISVRHTGLGRGRLLPWQDIAGVQVNQYRTQSGIGRNVKVVLFNGRRRTLPMLSDTRSLRDPDFDRKVVEIRARLAHHQGWLPAQWGTVPVPTTVESPLSRGNARLQRASWRYLAPVAAIMMLTFGSVDAGPAWSAHLGAGKHGTFTATAVNCSRSCTWTGDFASDDGTEIRPGVALGSGGKVHQVGDRVPAVDTGDRADVYPQGGGNDWIAVTGVALLGLVVLAAWLWTVPLASLRARKRPPVGGPGSTT